MRCQDGLNVPMSLRDDGWLAGVCYRVARLLRWKAWALRLLFVLLFLIDAFTAMLSYGFLALVFYLIDRAAPSAEVRTPWMRLQSPDLARREARINELDRRFREWEEGA